MARHLQLAQSLNLCSTGRSRECGGECSPATEADPEGAVGESHSSGNASCRRVTGLFLVEGNTSTCLSVNGLNSSKKKD